MRLRYDRRLASLLGNQCANVHELHLTYNRYAPPRPAATSQWYRVGIHSPFVLCMHARSELPYEQSNFYRSRSLACYNITFLSLQILVDKNERSFKVAVQVLHARAETVG